MPDGTLIAMIKSSDFLVELVQLPDYEGYQDGLINHFAMIVADIELAQKELEEKGIQFEMEKPVLMENVLDGVKFLMFRGPDGEHIEIDQLL